MDIGEAFGNEQGGLEIQTNELARRCVNVEEGIAMYISLEHMRTSIERRTIDIAK